MTEDPLPIKGICFSIKGQTMKKIILVFLIILFLFVMFHLHNNFFTLRMIKGTYISYTSDITLTGTVSSDIDTLHILGNGKFHSKILGNGNYGIVYSYKGTKIELRYTYEFGEAGILTYMARSWFGRPKIVMSHDFSHYYQKIN